MENSQKSTLIKGIQPLYSGTENPAPLNHLKPREYSAAELGFDRFGVSKNAVDVIQGLQRSGFDGYLVGGCVRDLIMGRQPKDFDVATNASPEQIKKIFDRARVVGRRFKLVHVACGRGWSREIIEVATYRAMPGKPGQKEIRGRCKTARSGRILDDNVYGTIEVDAMRRDFTVNALYYDPIKEKVIDFVHGVDDVKAKTLKIIGQIDIRFAEDPVRMLRVIRFQARLGLHVDTSIASAIEKNASRLSDVPAARLFEEVLKLFHYAAAESTWLYLRNTLLLFYLFPLTVNCINRDGGDKFESLILGALKNTDLRIEQNKPVIPGYLFAVLLWRPFQTELEKLISRRIRHNEAVWTAGDTVFRQQSRSITLPLRVKEPAREIWEMQRLLENRIPRSIQRLLENRRFRAAYDFLLLRQETGEVDEALADWWSRIQICDHDQRQQMIENLRKNPAPNRQKRQRRAGRVGTATLDKDKARSGSTKSP